MAVVLLSVLCPYFRVPAAVPVLPEPLARVALAAVHRQLLDDVVGVTDNRLEFRLSCVVSSSIVA